MTSTTIKIIALILMLIDHIAEFIPGIPIWFHWIGRLSAPLFIYTMVWGLHYTHDRRKYLKRIYFFGSAMAVGDLILNNIIKNPYAPITNNIFVMFFLIGVIVSIKEYKKENPIEGKKMMRKFIIFQILSTIICILGMIFVPLRASIMLFSALLPNLIFCEGSFIFVFLGVLMYYFKDTKLNTIKSYGIFCIIYFLLTLAGGHDLNHLLFVDYQWMMIAALPFMLCYNGKKGTGLEYLFYFFYPIHIAILYLVGNFLF